MRPRGTAFTVSYNNIVRELFLHVRVGKPGDPPDAMQAFTAIWDTGATNTVINQAVVDRLGLVDIIDVVDTESANGPGKADAYYVDLELPNGVRFDRLKVIKMKTKADVLIGMDIIATGDCCVSHVGGRTTLTFEYPSNHCYDFVKQINAGRKHQLPQSRQHRKNRKR